MNPYLALALAMCVIVALALAATAYLAAALNRRAKADLTARLTPLADAIDGETDVEEALVKGRYGGHLVFGRVANAPGGIGRLFHVELVDAAGGEGWEWSSLPEKGSPAPTRTFEGASGLDDRLGIDWVAESRVVPEAAHQRYGFAYDPAAGMVRLTRAMRTRLDIPDPATFVAQLDTLVRLAAINRQVQSAPDADATVMSEPATGSDPAPETR